MRKPLSAVVLLMLLFGGLGSSSLMMRAFAQARPLRSSALTREQNAIKQEKRLGPKPTPHWYWHWQEWRLGEGYAKNHALARNLRPSRAPRYIPSWAWRRLHFFLLARASRLLAQARTKQHRPPKTTTTTTTSASTSIATTTTASAESSSTPLLPPSGKDWFGSSANGQMPVATIEGPVLNGQRQLGIIHSYKTLSSYAGTNTFPGRADDGTSLQTLSDGGRILFLNIQFKINGVFPAGTDTWSNVASGVYDSGYLIPLAQKIASWYSTYHRKIFISLDHEADGNLGVGVQGTSPSQFADAWRHVYDVFAANGARDACAFVFDMAGYKSRVSEWNAMYPGDAYVDWLGYDPYGHVAEHMNYGPPDGTAHDTFGEDESDPGIDDTGLSRFYKWAVGLGAKDPSTGLTYTKPGSTTMPLMLAEFGLSYDPTTADATYLSQYRQWWTDFVNLLAQGRYPQIRALVFFDSLPQYDPRLDVGTGTVASPQPGSILDSFRKLAALPRLNP